MDEVKIKKSIVKKINKKFLESLQNYRKMISYMVGDMPIGILCLPKNIENKLRKNGIDRVYDLFDRDLRKIKGIGKVGAGYITSSLDQFISIR